MPFHRIQSIRRQQPPASSSRVLINPTFPVSYRRTRVEVTWSLVSWSMAGLERKSLMKREKKKIKMFCCSKCGRHEENEKLYTRVAWLAARREVFKYQQRSFADAGGYMDVTESKLRWHQSRTFTASYICKERSKISVLRGTAYPRWVAALCPSKMLSRGFFSPGRSFAQKLRGRGNKNRTALPSQLSEVSQSAVALLVKHPPCSSNWAVGRDPGQNLKR